MKMLLGLRILFAAVAPICTAEISGFAVDGVNPSQAILFVDGEWQHGAECLQVKVSVQEEATDAVLKAYFYGADGTLLHTADKPTSQGTGKASTVKPTTQFEKGKKYEVFFGFPKAAEKWKRAIIVFGKPGEYAARIYPKDNLAKFDFPEKASASVSAVPGQKAPMPLLDKPIAELQALRDRFDGIVKVEVQQPYDAGIKDLNAKYIPALDRAQETAQQSGKLEEAFAIKADKEAVATGRGVPAADEVSTPPVIKKLRGTYRAAFGRLEAERVRRLQPLQAAFVRSLDALVTTLTKEGKLDEAMAVKYQRDELAAPVVAAAPAALGQTLGGPKMVLTARANIPSNSPDGYKFGPISKGDLITLKYLEGLWKDFGTQPTFNPDDPATVETSRLVVAKTSKDGVPGDVIVMVPPSTALTPFEFESPVASDQLVLRINANSSNARNPGAVVYQLEVKRLNASAIPVVGQPTARILPAEDLVRKPWQRTAPKRKAEWIFSRDNTVMASGDHKGTWAIRGNILRVDFASSWAEYSLEIEYSGEDRTLRELNSSDGKHTDVTLTQLGK